MNLIERIAQHVASGFTAAEVSIKLELEHAVKVSEDWVRKIMSADGFAAALASAQVRSAEVGAAVQEDATDVVEAADEVEDKVEDAAKTAEATLVGAKQPPAPAQTKE